MRHSERSEKNETGQTPLADRNPPAIKWSYQFQNKPVLAGDIQSLRYTLGYSYRETLFLLGYPKKVILGDKGGDEAVANMVVDPSLSILVRLLWAFPEDCPMPRMPSVQDMRKRFASLADKRGRDGMASSNWLAVMSGARYNNGADWQSQGRSPAPTTRRLFWVVQNMADKHGEREALTRWKAAVEAEARARGTTFQDIIDNKGGWPKLPGEVVPGGPARRKARSSDDEEDENQE